VLGTDTLVASAGLTGIWMVALIGFVRGGFNAITPPERAPIWWPFSVAAWRGQRRATYVVLPFSGAFIATCWLAIASSHGILPAVVPVVASGVVLLSFGLFTSIVLFNRPKFVVPPTMRNEKGAIDVWLSRSADGRR